MNAQPASLKAASAAAIKSITQERLEGEAFAARWKAERRHKATLDALYPPTFPYPGHRTCAEWQ